MFKSFRFWLISKLAGKERIVLNAVIDFSENKQVIDARYKKEEKYGIVKNCIIKGSNTDLKSNRIGPVLF